MNSLLEHANVTVASIERTIDFLHAAFPNWKIRGEGKLSGPDTGRWCHFGQDDCYLALQQNDNHRPKQDSVYGHDGINHLGFVIDNMEKLTERLAEAGYQCTALSALTDHPFRKRAYFIDANDLEWEFVEYLSDKVGERNDYSL